DRAWCAHAARGRLAEVERRHRLYRSHPLKPDADELAVLVDDGIATGKSGAFRGNARLCLPGSASLVLGGLRQSLAPPACVLPRKTPDPSPPARTISAARGDASGVG